jgi:hypothetical protein
MFQEKKNWLRERKYQGKKQKKILKKKRNGKK